MKRVTDLNFWMHPYAMQNMDSLIYNTQKDWSFLIVISGSGKTRMGKSMLAQQLAYYAAYKLKRSFSMENVVFSGEQLIQRAKKLSPAIFIMDESRADLASTKYFQKSHQNLVDFFNESGKLNNMVFLVLPDFFDLSRSVAVNMSECLINCWKHKEKKKNKEGGEVSEYLRGYYDFYNDERKNDLYNNWRQKRFYIKKLRNFWGEWRHYWVLDEVKYEQAKNEFIHRQRESAPVGTKADLWRKQRNALLAMLRDKEIPAREILEKYQRNGIEVSLRSIYKSITSDTPIRT